MSKNLKASLVHGFVFNTDSNHSFGKYTFLNQFGMITVQECKEIITKLTSKLEVGEYLKSIEIDLSDYNEYQENGCPIVSSEENPRARKGIEKSATYNIKSNTLIIWENGSPVYENSNGTICRDAAALGDSIL